MECAVFVSERRARRVCDVVRRVHKSAGVSRQFQRRCLVGFRVWFHRKPDAPREFISEKMMEQST
jgi:hypothetical protein